MDILNRSSNAASRFSKVLIYLPFTVLVIPYYTVYFDGGLSGQDTGIHFRADRGLWAKESFFRLLVLTSWPFFLYALFQKSWRLQDAAVVSLLSWLIAHTIASIMNDEMLLCSASLLTFYPFFGVPLIISHILGRMMSLFIPEQFDASNLFIDRDLSDRGQ